MPPPPDYRGTTFSKSGGDKTAFPERKLFKEVNDTEIHKDWIKLFTQFVNENKYSILMLSLAAYFLFNDIASRIQ